LNARNDLIARLQSSGEWDVVVIGGGASGLGVSVDAASRGLKTVLFEQYDFAKGTSSKSTKLVHGGVRYLEQGDINLVMEALRERGLLEQNAKHLFKQLEFIIPSYTWWKGIYYFIGLKLYDFLSVRWSLGPSRWMNKTRVSQFLPTLKKDHLKSGVSYFDGQFDDARLAVNLAQTILEQGGLPLNYMKVVAFEKDADDQIKSVHVADKENNGNYKVSGKIFVNATGIFTDTIKKMYHPGHKKTIVPSQGIHLVLDKSFLKSEMAILIPKTSDGRVLFIIPWYDKVIAGTTDTPIKKPQIEPLPLSQEVEFILNTINQYLSKPATKKDVLSVFSGLRPLAKGRKEETSTKEVSRSHKLIIDNNLISIVGGKWTTYRKMGEDVMDKVLEKFPLEGAPCHTHHLAIHGNKEPDPTLPDHLQFYGSDLPEYLQLEGSDPTFGIQIHPNYAFTQGQIIWGIRYEMARTVEDFLSRRIRLLLLDARAAQEAAPTVARVMALELGRNNVWEKEQVTEFNELCKNYQLHSNIIF
jgi:glycerol-3-phosphate dehydrogenase